MLLLLDAGADLNAREREGGTPAYWAANEGAVDCLELLISRGANITTCDDHGHSPLHAAAAGGWAACCKRLIDAGASIGPGSGEVWRRDPRRAGAVFCAPASRVIHSVRS